MPNQDGENSLTNTYTHTCLALSPPGPADTPHPERAKLEPRRSVSLAGGLWAL